MNADKLFKGFLGLVCFLLIIGMLNHCANGITKTKEVIYVPVNDSTNINKAVLLQKQLEEARDSIIVLNDSIILLKNGIDKMTETLFIANYKLERIRYYNKIAANGKNITFLRGWINRVLEE